jgi:hypothetical protein
MKEEWREEFMFLDSLGEKIWITFHCEFGNEEVEEGTGKGKVAYVCRGKELGTYALELLVLFWWWGLSALQLWRRIVL